jgi:hypothetical protein
MKKLIKFFTSMDSLNLEEGNEYEMISSETISSFEDKNFQFNQAFTRYLTIIIDNEDNQALKIGKIETYMQPVVLTGRFEQNGTYFLCYGNTDANYPNYDIAYFKEKIPSNLSELNYEVIPIVQKNVTIQEKTKPISQMWLWLIIGVVIIILLIFTLKMINTKSGEN